MPPSRGGILHTGGIREASHIALTRPSNRADVSSRPKQAYAPGELQDVGVLEGAGDRTVFGGWFGQFICGGHADQVLWRVAWCRFAARSRQDRPRPRKPAHRDATPKVPEPRARKPLRLRLGRGAGVVYHDNLGGEQVSVNPRRGHKPTRILAKCLRRTFSSHARTAVDRFERSTRVKPAGGSTVTVSASSCLSAPFVLTASSAPTHQRPATSSRSPPFIRGGRAPRSAARPRTRSSTSSAKMAAPAARSLGAPTFALRLDRPNPFADRANTCS